MKGKKKLNIIVREGKVVKKGGGSKEMSKMKEGETRKGKY